MRERTRGRGVGPVKGQLPISRRSVVRCCPERVGRAIDQKNDEENRTRPERASRAREGSKEDRSIACQTPLCSYLLYLLPLSVVFVVMKDSEREGVTVLRGRMLVRRTFLLDRNWAQAFFSSCQSHYNFRLFFLSMKRESLFVTGLQCQGSEGECLSSQVSEGRSFSLGYPYVIYFDMQTQERLGSLCNRMKPNERKISEKNLSSDPPIELLFPLLSNAAILSKAVRASRLGVVSTLFLLKVPHTGHTGTWTYVHRHIPHVSSSRLKPRKEEIFLTQPLSFLSLLLLPP